MTLEKQKNEFVVECDNCGEVFETGAVDFKEALLCLQDQGWAYNNTSGVWQHFCPVCAEEMEEEEESGD